MALVEPWLANRLSRPAARDDRAASTGMFSDPAGPMDEARRSVARRGRDLGRPARDHGQSRNLNSRIAMLDRQFLFRAFRAGLVLAVGARLCAGSAGRAPMPACTAAAAGRWPGGCWDCGWRAWRCCCWRFSSRSGVINSAARRAPCWPWSSTIRKACRCRRPVPMAARCRVINGLAIGSIRRRSPGSSPATSTSNGLASMAGPWTSCRASRRSSRPIWPMRWRAWRPASAARAPGPWC